MVCLMSLNFRIGGRNSVIPINHALMKVVPVNIALVRWLSKI